MKYLKRPFYAVLLAAVIVIASTLLSVNIKVGNDSREMSAAFYDGVVVNGYKQKGIATHLNNITGCTDGIVSIVKDYGIDTEELSVSTEDLILALTYSENDASYIYYCYKELLTSLNNLESEMSGIELNGRDSEGYEKYLSTINGAVSAIDESGYNAAVREFLRNYSGFPANILCEYADVFMPEYFA